jgi:hypothetical protein
MRSVKIYNDYKLCYFSDETGWLVGGSSPAGAGNFSPHPHVQTGSGAHPASYPVGIRGSFPGDKVPGCEADYSPPSSSEVKNAWNYTSIPQYAFGAQLKHRDDFYLYRY